MFPDVPKPDKTMNLLIDYLPYAEVLRIGTPLQVPSKVNIMFDVFLQGEGWYAPEADADTWFRWVGPDKRGEVSFLIDRTRAIEVNLYIYRLISDDVLESIVIECEGFSLPFLVSYTDDKRLIRFIIPARVSNEVSITSFYVVSPLGRSTEHDTRYRSAAFSSACVHQAPEDEPRKRSETVVSITSAVSSLLRSVSDIIPITDLRLDPLLHPDFSIKLTGHHMTDDSSNFSLLLTNIKFGMLYGTLGMEIKFVSDIEIKVRFDLNLSSGPLPQLLSYQASHYNYDCDRFVSLQKQRPLSTFTSRAERAAPSAFRTLASSLFAVEAYSSLEKTDTSDLDVVGVSKWVSFVETVNSTLVVELARIQTTRLTGFGEPEILGDVEGRWTSTVKSSVNLSAPLLGPLKLSVELRKIFEPCHGTKITIVFGSYYWTLDLTEPGAIEAYAFLDIPVDRVELIIPSAISPAALGRSSDDRKLGVFVSKIKISPVDRLSSVDLSAHVLTRYDNRGI